MQVIIFDKPYNKQVTLTKEQSVHIPRIGERVFVFNYTPTPYVTNVIYDYTRNIIIVELNGE